MPITWNEELECNDPLVNAQHKEIFKRISDLNKVTIEHRANDLDDIIKNKIKETLNFLTDYVEIHFRDEEDLMKRNNYLKFGEHKKLHDDFVEVIKRETEKYQKSRGSLLDIINLNILISKWLVNHILKADLEMIKSFKILNDPIGL
jgi:hemerythrin